VVSAILRGREAALDAYDAWLADFRRRLAQHDAGVALLALDLASRTTWTVRAKGAGEFDAPPPTAGEPADVHCERGTTRPLCFEVELPETLVRRATVQRLRHLEATGIEPRVCLVSEASSHERQIAEARRMLRRAGLSLSVAAIAPGEDTITGADW
jgi:hypothetical protein